MLIYSENILFPVGIYLFKLNNRSTRRQCDPCPKLIKKMPEQRQLTWTVSWSSSGVFFFNFELVNVS